MDRILVIVSFCMAAVLGVGTARGEPFTDHLDAAIAALETRSSSGALTRAQQGAVDKALGLLAEPHDRLSQDLRTGAKVCILGARYLPRDRELFDIVEAGLNAMEDEVVANADALVLALADSTLSARKQIKRSRKVTRPLGKAQQIPDPALKAKRFARIQALIERLTARYGS